jgi:hypothetical protein
MSLSGLLWVTTGACVGAMLIVVVPFRCAFREWPIEQTNPDSWAQFATYFSGLVGPILSTLTSASCWMKCVESASESNLAYIVSPKLKRLAV